MSEQGRREIQAILPRFGQNVYVASTAYVGGEVVIGDDCTLMHHVVVRGDVSSIAIGRRVNIQDGSVVHTQTDVPLTIEDDVAIGHRAVVHCQYVGRRVLIGIGAIVLDGVLLGEGCIVGAGAVVTPGTTVPPGSVVMGTPARVIRDVTDTERGYVREVVETYRRLGMEHARGSYPNSSPQPPNGTVS